MKSFIKNTSSAFVRIARIQINSPLRNKNLYPDHYYKITCKFDEIYTPGSAGIKERILEIYTGTSTPIFFSNVSAFYYKIVDDNGNQYIDIATTSPNNYTNIRVDVETVNEGTVTLYRENAIQNDYTRINFVGTNLNYIMTSFVYAYVGANTSLNLTTIKDCVLRVTDMNNGVIGYVLNTGSLKNGDNTAFTISVGGTESDYSRTITLTAKVNCNFIVEVLK